MRLGKKSAIEVGGLKKLSSKNKTHKKLILKEGSRITLHVARVTVFETNKGIGNRCGDTRKRGKTGGC
jgi:hypothetical protein